MIDDMDEIWVLYADDGAQALDTAEDALRQISGEDVAARADGISSLFRAVHTFKGNARVLGLQVAESRAHVTEDLIGLVRDQGAAWDAEMDDILLLAVDRLRVILEQTAAERKDVDPEFASDLMVRLHDKIARINGLAAEGATEAATLSSPEPQGQPESTPALQAAPLAEEPAMPESLPEAQAQPAEPVATEPVAAPAAELASAVAAPVSEKPTGRGSSAQILLANILEVLGRLSNPEPGSDTKQMRAQALAEIADQAERCGYRRLADTSLLLSKSDPAENQNDDVRLYEELYSIEMSLAQGDIQRPRPHDLLAGWCAENAFLLLDQLRSEVTLLAEGHDIEASVRRIEPLLRRLSIASDYFGMRRAAELAMSLLDLLLRMVMPGGVGDAGPDKTIVQMLETYIQTVELALDAAQQGETPEIKVLEDLSEESTGFAFRNKGAVPATEALDQLHLPAQFLRVMSPRSVLVAQSAAQAGMSFRVVRTDFKEETEVAERFFGMMEDGSIRQITSVSVMSGLTAKFDFLLATHLPEAAFEARLKAIDPSGRCLHAVASEGLAQTGTKFASVASDIAGGVSVEMMEMLGEVSAGLASVSIQLRDASEADVRQVVAQVFDEERTDPATVQPKVMAEFDRIAGRIEQTLQTMEHLARRVATLQEEAMASRLRPADHVLRPLVDQLRKDAQSSGELVKIALRISQVPLDRHTLESLEQICQRYVSLRIDAHDKAEGEIEVALRQRDDRAMLTVQDHHSAPIPPEIVGELQKLAALAGGRVWLHARAEGGQRLAVSLPTKMLAMEGMVVSSGAVQYVLPVDAVAMVLQADPARIVSRAAAGSARYLKLDDNEVLPITALKGSTSTKGGIFVIVQAEGRRRAVLVDALVGQQVVRLRPLQGVLSQLERLAGLAVLAGGEVALVLSPLSICFGDEIENVAFAEA
jgi:two-component system, chemotaxis family, sensor kinase CheA